MRNPGVITLFLVALATVGCTPQKMDLVELREEVKAADIEFDEAVASMDRQRFADLVAEDAVFYSPKPVEGREAVVADWAPFFDPDSGVSLRWHPVAAEVAASGDLGLTRGVYELTRTTEDGAVSKGAGSYVTVWRRSTGGKWQALVDIGTPSEPMTD